MRPGRGREDHESGGDAVGRATGEQRTVRTSAQVRDIVRILTEVGESKRYLGLMKRMATAQGGASVAFEPPEPPSGTTWERDLTWKTTRRPGIGWRLRIQIQDLGAQREVSFDVKTSKLVGAEKKAPRNAMEMMIAALPA